MTNINPSRLGVKNLSGSSVALFDDVFINQVRLTFEANTRFLGLTQTRTISSGKGATFPHMGKIEGAFHTPGDELAGQDIAHSETFIKIDGKIVAHTWLADQDEWQSEIQLRMEYATAIARGLSRAYDKMIAFKAVKGARQGSELTAGPGGGRPGGTTGGQDETDGATAPGGGTVDYRVASTNALTSADSLDTLIANAVSILDEKDVPEEDRVVVVRPAQYMRLLKAGKLFMDRDFGGEGSIARKLLPWMYGARVVVSNHLPSSQAGGPAAGTHGEPVNATTGSALFGDGTDNEAQSGGNDYSGNNDGSSNDPNFTDNDPTLGFGGTAALVMQREALGTVVLKDVDMQSEESVRNQATLLTGRYMVGNGVLRPEALVEVTQNPTVGT